MQPNEANIQAMGQTARMTSATQGNKPQGPLGIVPDATPGMVSVEQKNAKQTTDASSAATNASKAGPATTQVSGNLGTTTGAASGTGLISGQMMSRRI
jgi:hypothetical protein